MRASVIFWVCLLGWRIASAQLAEAIRFDEVIHDFGEIQEDDGPVEYEFTFQNLTGASVVIVGVKASCGCTTPDWTQSPVPNGGRGLVEARFDPKGRPGYFNKTLSVQTDWDAKPYVLQIKGQVVNGSESNPNKNFTSAKGNLHFEYGSFNMGNVFINQDPVQHEFLFKNAGNKPIHIKRTVAPPYIKVTTPAMVGVGETASLTLTFDAAARHQYGFASENIELHTDDDVEPVKSISVYATVSEFFPAAAAGAKALPRIVVDTLAIDLGRIREGESKQGTVGLRNEGNKRLLIRAAQTNCSCVRVGSVPAQVEASQAAAIPFTFDATNRKGPQQKAITIYSNDPADAVVRVTILAYVED